MKDLVSIVIPVYNASRFIKFTIDSVLNQTYSQWELLLVDDCSTDNSLSICKEYVAKDNRIHLIESTVNAGVAVTRNVGIKHASGKYIALLDSDDIWYPNKLQMQIDLIAKTHSSMCYCSYDFIDEKGDSIKKPFFVPFETSFKKMLGKCVISCSTAIIDADLLKNNLFPTDFYVEDYLLWMKLLSIPGVSAYGCKEVLASYRQLKGSRSSNKIHAAKERWIAFRQGLNLNVMESGLAFIKYAFFSIVKYYF